MTYVVIAEAEEMKLVKKFRLNDYPVIITGVGGVNVINALKDLPRDSKIINVGYCGSNDYDVGNVCEIGDVALFIEKCDKGNEWELNCEPLDWNLTSDEIFDVACYTSVDFVEKSKNIYGVFDMELAFIRSLFDNVSAIKVVSDKLNYEEYKENIK